MPVDAYCDCTAIEKEPNRKFYATPENKGYDPSSALCKSTQSTFLPEFKTTPNSRDGAKKIDTSGMRRSWRYQLPNGTSYEQVVDVLLATPEETIEALHSRGKERTTK